MWSLSQERSCLMEETNPEPSQTAMKKYNCWALKGLTDRVLLPHVIITALVSPLYDAVDHPSPPLSSVGAHCSSLPSWLVHLCLCVPFSPLFLIIFANSTIPQDSIGVETSLSMHVGYVYICGIHVHPCDGCIQPCDVCVNACGSWRSLPCVFFSCSLPYVLFACLFVLRQNLSLNLEFIG